MNDLLRDILAHREWADATHATRLRELGGEPPTTDLILWYWSQWPAALWERSL